MVNTRLVWDQDPDTIDSLFDQMIISKYPNFKFKYPWQKIREIGTYLKKLMISSYLSGSETLASVLPSYMLDIENFFTSAISLKYIDRNNYLKVIERLSGDDGLRHLDTLTTQRYGIFVASSFNDVLQITPNPQKSEASPLLNEKDIRRLYTYEAMAHKILNIGNDENSIELFMSTIRNIVRSKGAYPKLGEEMDEIPKGFSMLDKALSQELAESITYYTAGLDRPYYERRVDLGKEVYSNHDRNAIYQMPTVEFGKTLRGMTNIFPTNESVLKNMIRKAINGDFILDVMREYYQKEGKDPYYDLYKTLVCMGTLLDRKNTLMGRGCLMQLDVDKCLKATYELVRRNADPEESPLEGFGDMDFLEYVDYYENDDMSPRGYGFGKK